MLVKFGKEVFVFWFGFLSLKEKRRSTKLIYYVTQVLQRKSNNKLLTTYNNMPSCYQCYESSTVVNLGMAVSLIPHRDSVEYIQSLAPLHRYSIGDLVRFK